jgi:ABC-type Fe3+-hydroxamate transport system substrate-binding protein
VALETIAERNPDAFVSFTDEIPAFARRPEWQTIEAVREARFALVTGSEFSYPSPRALEAVQRLRTALERVNR